jgi:hypothetical protein
MAAHEIDRPITLLTSPVSSVDFVSGCLIEFLDPICRSVGSCFNWGKIPISVKIEQNMNTHAIFGYFWGFFERVLAAITALAWRNNLSLGENLSSGSSGKILKLGMPGGHRRLQQSTRSATQRRSWLSFAIARVAKRSSVNARRTHVSNSDRFFFRRRGSLTANPFRAK